MRTNIQATTVTIAAMMHVLRFMLAISLSRFSPAELAIVCYVMSESWLVPRFLRGERKAVPIAIRPTALSETTDCDRSRLSKAMGRLISGSVLLVRAEGTVVLNPDWKGWGYSDGKARISESSYDYIQGSMDESMNETDRGAGATLPADACSAGATDRGAGATLPADACSAGATDIDPAHYMERAPTGAHACDPIGAGARPKPESYHKASPILTTDRSFVGPDHLYIAHADAFDAGATAAPWGEKTNKYISDEELPSEPINQQCQQQCNHLETQGNLDSAGNGHCSAMHPNNHQCINPSIPPSHDDRTRFGASYPGDTEPDQAMLDKTLALIDRFFPMMNIETEVNLYKYTYESSWILKAMKRHLATKPNIRNFGYTHKIIKNWVAAGGPDNGPEDEFDDTMRWVGIVAVGEKVQGPTHEQYFEKERLIAEEQAERLKAAYLYIRRNRANA